MRLGRLGTDACTELLEGRLGPAVRDDLVERRDGGADALHLRLRLEAAADDPQPPRPRPRQVLRRDAARGTRAELSKTVRLDDADALARRCVEQRHDEGRTYVLLPAMPSPLSTAPMSASAGPFELQAQSRLVHDLAGRDPAKRVLHDRHGVGRHEERFHVRLCEVERHG